MKNRIGNYKIDDKVYAKFRSEIERWIENGWLKKTTETESGIIPLLAVVQTKKNKVRPVLDFREMNDFVECSGADADVCDEKLRQWRQKTSNCALLDLRDAYMQIIVDKECSKYQIVKFENEFYELCQLGFGLDCAPEIMKWGAKDIVIKTDSAAVHAWMSSILKRQTDTSFRPIRNACQTATVSTC